MADQEAPPVSESAQVEGSDLTNVPTSTTPSNARTCGVCLTRPAKYKCTRCELPYCSIPCNLEHKANHPEVPLPEPEAPEIKDPVIETSPTNGNKPAPRAGTQGAAGQSHVLAPLLASSDLKRLFTLYPSLREQLREIYNASQPPMDDGLGYSPNDRRVRYSGSRDKPFWTREQGTRDGVEALKEAKNKFGKDGEGVREFANLVVSIISPENAINGNLDGPSVIQKHTDAENAKMISQLLQGELGNA